MLVYIIIMALIILLEPICKINIKVKNKRKIIQGKEIYLILILSVFMITMAIRSMNVGVDTAPYSRTYKNILSYPSLREAINGGLSNAPVYVAFCRLLGIAFKNPQWLNVFTAVIINVGLYKYIKKTSSNYLMSLFTWMGLTCFFFAMNGNRQTIAMILAMNSFSLLLENIKSKKGWILLALALGTHVTVTFLLIGLLLIKFADVVKNKIGIIWYSLVGSILLSVILSKIVPLLSTVFEHYNMYSNGESKYSILSGTGNGRVVILYLFLMVVCIIYYIKFRNNRDLYSTKLLPALIFGVCFGILNCKNELINRMVFFYIGFFISFIPDAIDAFKGKERVLAKLTILAIVGTYGILSLIINLNGVVPYTTFLQ